MQSWEQAVGRGQDGMQRSSRRRRGLFDNGRTSERAAQAEYHVGIGKRRASRRGVWFVVAVVVVGGGGSEQQL
jgi:hypothetical protein